MEQPRLRVRSETKRRTGEWRRVGHIGAGIHDCTDPGERPPPPPPPIDFDRWRRLRGRSGGSRWEERLFGGHRGSGAIEETAAAILAKRGGPARIDPWSWSGALRTAPPHIDSGRWRSLRGGAGESRWEERPTGIPPGERCDRGGGRRHIGEEGRLGTHRYSELEHRIERKCRGAGRPGSALGASLDKRARTEQ